MFLKEQNCNIVKNYYKFYFNLFKSMEIHGIGKAEFSTNNFLEIFL